MGRPKDPTLGRTNFRLRQIATSMQSSWSAFREAKEYEKRREYLTHLRARIDDWLAEPALVYDLVEGRAAAGGRERWSRLSPPDVEFPFDKPGEATDTFFYHSYRNSSELFTREQVELDEVKSCVLGRSSYFVALLKKVYATEAQTARHFFSDSAFDRHAKSASADQHYRKGRYHVLADPAGHRDGHTLVACSSDRPAHARKRAEELAARFGIRCLVGRVEFAMDTH